MDNHASVHDFSTCLNALMITGSLALGYVAMGLNSFRKQVREYKVASQDFSDVTERVMFERALVAHDASNLDSCDLLPMRVQATRGLVESTTAHYPQANDGSLYSLLMRKPRLRLSRAYSSFEAALAVSTR